MIELLTNIFKRYRIINFMFVGGLSFIVSIAIYYPLTLFFESHVTWLGQEFYLPATIPSTVISLIFGYYANRKWTFGDCKAKRLSLLRYLAMGMATWLGDVFILFILVHYWGIYWLLGSVMAVLIMFAVRYLISKYWIWRTHDKKVLA